MLGRKSGVTQAGLRQTVLAGEATLSERELTDTTFAWCCSKRALVLG